MSNAIWQRLSNAKKTLRLARGRADDNGTPRSSNWYDAREAELRRAEQKFTEARAAWVAAGRPDPRGRPQPAPRAASPGGEHA